MVCNAWTIGGGPVANAAIEARSCMNTSGVGGGSFKVPQRVRTLWRRSGNSGPLIVLSNEPRHIHANADHQSPCKRLVIKPMLQYSLPVAVQVARSSMRKQ